MKTLRTLLIALALTLSSCQSAARRADSVVLIETEKEVMVQDFIGFMTHKPPKKEIMYGSSTGFSINGNIVTCYHCIDGVYKITITERNGRKQEARVIKVDKKLDLAMLYVPKKIPSLRFGNEPVHRDRVSVIGNPLEMRWVMTRGVYLQHVEEWTFYDVTIAPGNSGSPVFNQWGEVVSMAHAILRANPRIMFGSNLEDLRAFCTE